MMKEIKWTVCANSLVWRIIEGEAVIPGVDGNSYFTLNESGTMMWDMLNKGYGSGEIVSAVSLQYGLAKAEAEKDFKAFAASLEKEKLIKRKK